MNNFLVFLMPLFMFTYFLYVGYGLLTLAQPRENQLKKMLIAPGVGLALIILLVFNLNWLGLPVASFARPLAVILFILSTGILLIKKPKIPFPQYAPFFMIFILGLFLCARPFLDFGLNWISYGNDDFANYCLGAQRFLTHGYHDPMNVTAIMNHQNYSEYTWFLYVITLVRPGGELLLAFVSKCLNLIPVEIFMLTIVSIFLGIISASSALVQNILRNKKASLLTALLIACSGLITFGVLYQMLGQIIGLLIFICLAVFLLNEKNCLSKNNFVKDSVLISLFISTMLISYPELMSMLVLALIIYLIVRVLNKRNSLKKILNRYAFLRFCLTTIFTLLFLRGYIYSCLVFIRMQLDFVTKNLNSLNSIFGYYLDYSGIANLWGILPLTVIPSELWLIIAIISSIILTTILFVGMIYFFKKNYNIISIGISFFLMVVFFLWKQNGFALFKLAMYVQPFIFIMLVVFIFSVHKRKINLKIFSVILFTALVAANITTQIFYVNRSYGEPGVFVDMPYVSQAKLFDKFKNNQLLSNSTELGLMADNLCVIKISMLFTVGKDLIPYSQNYFYEYAISDKRDYKKFMSQDLLNAINDYIHTVKKDNIIAYFTFDTNHQTKNKFIMQKDSALMNRNIIVSMPDKSVFNRNKLSNHQAITILSPKQYTNLLVFTSSEFGQNYYFGNPEYIGLYPIEKDYFSDQVIAGFGRYLLFRIINPTDNFRTVVNITTTLNPQRNSSLPKAAVYGDKKYSLNFIGHGSARIISEPVKPQIIDGVPFINFDMNVVGNNSLRIGYIRDMSLISEKDFALLKRPSGVSKFPQDLYNPNLEYSGIYEDGWVSDNAVIILHNTNKKLPLIIEGILPQLSAKTNLTRLSIYVNGKLWKNVNLKSGDFKIQGELLDRAPNQRITLNFSPAMNLPSPDDRVIGAKLTYIGFGEREKELKALNSAAGITILQLFVDSFREIFKKFCHPDFGIFSSSTRTISL